MLNNVELSKLRWSCRRGLLENDLILERFLKNRGQNISTVEYQQLNDLLTLDDTELWEIIAGRSESFPESSKTMVEMLRQTRVTHQSTH